MPDNKEKFEQLNQVIEELRDQPGALMPVMQRAQSIFGCVSLDVQKAIAEGLGVTLSEVYGVATFYSQFKLKPAGKYVISVCLGTACYVKGSQKRHHGRRTVHPAGHALPGRLRPGPGHDRERRGVRPPGARRHPGHPGQI